MEPTTESSPRFSFKGWSWKRYLAKNKEGMKWILTLFFTYLGAVSLTVENPELKALLVGVIGFASKFLLNAVDYWFSEGAG